MCTWRTLNTEMQRRSEAERSAAAGNQIAAATAGNQIEAKPSARMQLRTNERWQNVANSQQYGIRF